MCVVSAFHLWKTATRRYLTFAHPPGERAADKDYEEHMAFERPCSASVLWRDGWKDEQGDATSSVSRAPR
jgi:hypothetical protein